MRAIQGVACERATTARVLVIVTLLFVVGTDVEAQEQGLSTRLLHSLGDSQSDPATIFGAYQSVAMSSRGDLYIADGSFAEIRLFRNGEHVVTRGRQGRGPGEFAGLHSICLTLDERYVVAYDYAIPRLSYFDANTLDYIRSATPEKAAGSIYAVECGAQGDVLLSGYMAGETGLVHAFDSQGSYLRSYADLASDLFAGLVQAARVQLGQTHSTRLGTDGMLVALMAPYRVARVSSGGIQWSIRDPFVGNPMGEYITATVDRFSTKPYKSVTGVYTLGDGRFAVTIVDPNSDESWLDVRAPSDGRLLYRYELPAGTVVLATRPGTNDEKGRIVFRQNRPYPVIEVPEW